MRLFCYRYQPWLAAFRWIAAEDIADAATRAVLFVGRNNDGGPPFEIARDCKYDHCITAATRAGDLLREEDYS